MILPYVTAAFLALCLVNGASHIKREHCDDHHKVQEIMATLRSWYHDGEYAYIKAVELVYSELFLSQLGYNAPMLPAKRGGGGGHGQGVPDLFASHDHGSHGIDHEIDHIQKELYDHLNYICRNQVLNFLKHLLHVDLESTTTHAPVRTTVNTTHVQATKATTTEVPTTTVAVATTTTTTDVPTATTLGTTSTTLAPLNVSHLCDAMTFVTALGKGEPIEEPEAGICTDETHSQSEALIINSCGTRSPASWTEGPNVMENCERIPTFTPIATFLFNQYSLDGTSMSGIFVECTGTGFKMAVQVCGHGPKIFELATGAGSARQNANSYYVIDCRNTGKTWSSGKFSCWIRCHGEEGDLCQITEYFCEADHFLTEFVSNC